MIPVLGGQIWWLLEVFLITKDINRQCGKCPSFIRFHHISCSYFLHLIWVAFFFCELYNSSLLGHYFMNLLTQRKAIFLIHIVKKSMNFGVRFKFKWKLCNLFNHLEPTLLPVFHLLHWFLINITFDSFYKPPLDACRR